MKAKFSKVLIWFVILGIAASACSQASPDPREVVDDFYTEYLAYNGNPLVDHAYRSSEQLSPDFIQFLDDFTQGGGMNYDPVLCAQDIPTEITTYPAQVSGSRALVDVTDSFYGHRLAVELILLDGEWLIDEIICAR